MRAPFAPPRLSEPRNVEADAQAVETNSDTDTPEERILAFNAVISSSPISGWFTAGIGSCHGSVSFGTSDPRYRAIGPMSRCVSLNQARANAFANCSGFSRKRFEIISYLGSKRRARSVVSIDGA